MEPNPYDPERARCDAPKMLDDKGKRMKDYWHVHVSYESGCAPGEAGNGAMNHHSKVIWDRSAKPFEEVVVFYNPSAIMDFIGKAKMQPEKWKVKECKVPKAELKRRRKAAGALAAAKAAVSKAKKPSKSKPKPEPEPESAPVPGSKAKFRSKKGKSTRRRYK